MARLGWRGGGHARQGSRAALHTPTAPPTLHHHPPFRLSWRLYVFKDGAPLPDPLHVHRQSAYLVGRERRVADVPADHPSVSKQHAVLQFR